jgi:hypothetical protein
VAQAAEVLLSKDIFGLLVIVGDLNVVRVSVLPDKAHPVLRVYPDCVLAKAIIFKRMKFISRGNFEVVQIFCGIDHIELSTGNFSDIRGDGATGPSLPKFASSFVGE